MAAQNQAGHKPRNYHAENIEGKAALVTGGTTGIGRATAVLLAERGARVLLFGRDQSDLDSALGEVRAASASGEVFGLSADQSDIEDIRRAFEEVDARLGGIDILVNNAAVTSGSALEGGLEEIRYGVNVNLVGTIACAREAIERMRARGGGHIVCVGSMSADQREEENEVYVATKAGIQAFCASLRKAVGKEGIKVSLIEPGAVATNMNPRDEEKMSSQKMIEAEDIAEAVHYVLTQPARCEIAAIQIKPLQQSV